MNCCVAQSPAETCSSFEPDNWELLIAAILAEAAELRAIDRSELAMRVLALGGYETADELEGGNDRARLALRLAARLTEAID